MYLFSGSFFLVMLVALLLGYMAFGLGGAIALAVVAFLIVH